MTQKMAPGNGQEKLGDLFLQLAGKLPSRMSSAKTRVQILQEAYAHLTPLQKHHAKVLIDSLETRWGLKSPEHGEINCTAERKQAERKIAEWLSRRKNAEALRRVLVQSAEGIAQGIDKLSDIQEYAYGILPGRDLTPVGYDAFKEWIIELKIGVPQKSGGGMVYKPGVWNEIWRGKV